MVARDSCIFYSASYRRASITIFDNYSLEVDRGRVQEKLLGDRVISYEVLYVYACGTEFGTTLDCLCHLGFLSEQIFNLLCKGQQFLISLLTKFC